jgi:hypothetical protein
MERLELPTRSGAEVLLFGMRGYFFNGAVEKAVETHAEFETTSTFVKTS